MSTTQTTLTAEPQAIAACVADTLQHIRTVSRYLIDFSERLRNFRNHDQPQRADLLDAFASQLLQRAKHHDDSKLEEPELSCFAIYGPRLKEVEFGSDEYLQNLREMQVALDHHYQMNSHHPQHYPNGVRV